MLLWDVLARSSAVLVVAALVNVALRGRSASLRHAVWAFGLAGALAVAPLSWVLPSWHVPLVPAWAAAREAAVPAAPAAPAVPESAHRVMPAAAVDVPEAPPATPAPSAALEAPAAAPTTAAAPAAPTPTPGMLARGWTAVQASWPLALAGLWALGTLILLGRLALANLATARAIRARASEPAPWLATARELACATGVPDTHFIRSETIAMPMAAGYLRPTVVLPAEADAWPDERITSVLLHELAHVRRRDCLTQLAASAACALYWMNPLAWYAAKALRQERERACDDAVLEAGTAGPDYAEHLLDVARAARHATPTFSGGVAMAHRSELEGRLMAILDDARNRQSISYGVAGIAGILCLALVTPLAALDPFVLGAAEAQPAAVPPGAGPELPSPKAPRPVAPRPAAQAPRGGISGGVVAPVIADAPETAAIAAEVAVASAPVIARETETRVNTAVATRVATTVATDVSMAFAFDDDQGLPTPAPTPTPSPSPQPSPAPRAVGQGPARAQTVRRDTPADPKVIAALGGALKDSDAEVRQQAAHSLGQMRDPAAVDVLLPALQDTDVEVRQNVVFALGQLRDERAIPGLTIALKDQNDEIRERAAFALAQFRDPKVVDPLLIAARDANSDVRRQALFAISQIDANRGKDAAIEALKDKDPEVRRMAVHLLGRLGRD